MFMAQADSCMSAVRHQVNNRSKEKIAHTKREKSHYMSWYFFDVQTTSKRRKTKNHHQNYNHFMETNIQFILLLRCSRKKRLL